MTTNTTPSPEAVASFLSPNLFQTLCQSFPNLTDLLAELQTTEAQLHEVAQSPHLTSKVELTLKLAGIRFQLKCAEFADAALAALAQIMNCNKPETARRCANTILELAGFLPANKSSFCGLGVPPMDHPTSQIPTPQNVITKQHPPIYNDLTTPNPTPQTSSPATPSAGTPASCRPKPPTSPQPTKIPQPLPISPAKTPASHPQYSPSKTNITKQYLPTYNNSLPLIPTYLQAATQAVSGTTNPHLTSPV